MRSKPASILLVALVVILQPHDVDAEGAIKRLPRRPLHELRGVHLSIAADNWTLAERSRSAPYDFEQEIRRRVGKSGFWAPASKNVPADEPELIVVISAHRVGVERTILLMHAVLVETVTVRSTSRINRAVTWHGIPWYGTSYPSSLAEDVRAGKDFVIADLDDFASFEP